MNDLLFNNSLIVDKIRAGIRRYFLSTYNEDIYSIEIESVDRRLYSALTYFKIRTNNHVLKLVAKTTIRHLRNRYLTDSKNQALVEYKILNELYPHFKKMIGCSVPYPMVVFPEIQTYVMEFVEGKTLSDQLKSDRLFYSKREFRKLKENFYYCGRWLKHFQTVTGSSKKAKGAMDSIKQRFESRMSLIEQLADPRIPERLARRVRKEFRSLLENIDGSTLPFTGRHGDFTPFNILSSERGVTVIDFLGYESDFISVDLLKFLVNLHDEKRSITSSRRRVCELRESFLSGYGDLPKVPLPAVLACEMMQRTVSLARNLLQRRRLPHHRIESRLIVTEHVRWISNQGRRLLWPNVYK